VEANLPAIDDETERAGLVAAVAVVEDLARQADEVDAEVRTMVQA
jgi:hypothetical protein